MTNFELSCPDIDESIGIAELSSCFGWWRKSNRIGSNHGRVPPGSSVGKNVDCQLWVQLQQWDFVYCGNVVCSTVFCKVSLQPSVREAGFWDQSNLRKMGSYALSLNQPIENHLKKSENFTFLCIYCCFGNTLILGRMKQRRLQMIQN